MRVTVGVHVTAGALTADREAAIRSALFSSSAACALLTIVAISVVLRLGSVAYFGTSIRELPGVTDQISYHELAVRVVNGHGFSFGEDWWPSTRANEPTAHWSYLYVVFLAAVYVVFGPAPLAARLVQALLVGVLHPLLAWRIGRRLFGPAVGLVSAGLTSAYGYFVFYAGALVTESLYFLAFLWALDVATALPKSAGKAPRSIRPWVLLGLALAASALLRQAFVLVIPLMLVWIAWQLSRRRDRERPVMAPRALAGRLALTLAVLLVCIGPWTIRNYRAFGQFVLLNTNAGFVFFWANHPIHGTEFIPVLSGGSTNYGALLPRELRTLDEAQLDQALFLRGVGFVRDDPVRYLRLSISRAKEYFKFWPSPGSSRTSNYARVMSFGLVVPFLIAGVFLALARQKGGGRRGTPGITLLLLVAALYSLVHLATWALVRYRLPVDAILMPFVALSMVSGFHRIRSLVRVSDVSLRHVAH